MQSKVRPGETRLPRPGMKRTFLNPQKAPLLFCDVEILLLHIDPDDLAEGMRPSDLSR